MQMEWNAMQSSKVDICGRKNTKWPLERLRIIRKMAWLPHILISIQLLDRMTPPDLKRSKHDWHFTTATKLSFFFHRASHCPRHDDRLAEVIPNTIVLRSNAFHTESRSCSYGTAVPRTTTVECSFVSMVHAVQCYLVQYVSVVLENPITLYSTQYFTD